MEVRVQCCQVEGPGVVGRMVVEGHGKVSR